MDSVRLFGTNSSRGKRWREFPRQSREEERLDPSRSNDTCDLIVARERERRRYSTQLSFLPIFLAKSYPCLFLFLYQHINICTRFRFQLASILVIIIFQFFFFKRLIIILYIFFKDYYMQVILLICI